jgi:hypothetical protein
MALVSVVSNHPGRDDHALRRARDGDQARRRTERYRSLPRHYQPQPGAGESGTRRDGAHQRRPAPATSPLVDTLRERLRETLAEAGLLPATTTATTDAHAHHHPACEQRGACGMTTLRLLLES